MYALVNAPLTSQKHKSNPKYKQTQNTNPKSEQTQNTKGFRSPRLQGATYCNLAKCSLLWIQNFSNFEKIVFLTISH